MTPDLPAPFHLSAAHVRRCADIGLRTARLAIARPDPDVAVELLHLMHAMVGRYTDLQKVWAGDWAEWGDYAAGISAAPTLPKFAEHGMNTVVRAQQLMSAQTTAAMNLAENATVGYSYWLDRKLGAD